MNNQQTEIVVLGAGYAGLLATVRLAGKLRRQPARITLVNESDVLIQRVLLHQFAAHGNVNARPLSKVLRGTGVNFVQGTVTHLDPTHRSVAVQTATGTRDLAYDHLVYALGSTTDRDSVPGVRDYAYT